MRLLLVEDNDRLAELVVKGLVDAGFTLDRVARLDEAAAALATAKFDTVVLDLSLPDGDGGDWLKERRAAGERVPVLMLTARAATGDKVKGLNSGADDYLAKPFEMAELVARVKALLRRPGGVLGLTLELGKLRFDTVHREAFVEDRPLPLSASELTLLELLLRRSGRVVARRLLEEGLYGFDDEVGPNSLEAHVSRLRKKLEAAEAGVQIHTLARHRLSRRRTQRMNGSLQFRLAWRLALVFSVVILATSFAILLHRGSGNTDIPARRADGGHRPGQRRALPRRRRQAAIGSAGGSRICLCGGYGRRQAPLRLRQAAARRSVLLVRRLPAKGRSDARPVARSTAPSAGWRSASAWTSAAPRAGWRCWAGSSTRNCCRCCCRPCWRGSSSAR